MRSKKLKRIIVALLVALIGINVVYAADLTPSYNGWDAVGESQVQLMQDMISLQKAKEQNGITLTGDFALVTSKRYTNEEIANGTYETDRNKSDILNYLSYPDSYDELFIVYNKTLTAGEHNVDGSVTLKWKDAAVLADGTLCDVTMIADNFTFKTGQNTKRPIGTLYDYWQNKSLAAGAWFAKQEWSGSEIVANNYNDIANNIGAAYDLTFKITKSGTDEEVVKNMVIGFKDLDVPDRTANSAYIDSNNNPLPYSESIVLMSGVKDKVYMTNDRYLYVADTTYGKNTKYAASRSTTNSDESPNETQKSGFITRVNSGNFKIRWAGSSCGTSIVGVTLAVVKTSTSGQYPNNVKISKTDKEILWKEDKGVKIDPDDGYSITQITIDGVVIPYNTLTLENGVRKYTNNGKTYTFKEDANGTVTYTFSNVISDHAIDVQVTKTIYTLTVNHVDKDTRAQMVAGYAPTENKFYGDSYTTSPLTSTTTPTLAVGYRLTGTPSNANGTITDNTVVTYEYEKLKGKVITTYIDTTTNNEIEVNGASTKETKTYSYGDNYETTKKDFNEYEFVRSTDNTSGTFTINNPGDEIHVIYYYKKKLATLTTSYVEEGTNTPVSKKTVQTVWFGDDYETKEASDIPQNYTFVSKTDNYKGVVNAKKIDVVYTYRKKDSKINATINKTGTDKITSINEKVNYNINYDGTFTDVIGNATITITDKLPYKIDVNQSDLNGGTYNEANNTITWQETREVNSYNDPKVSITKNVSLKYININPKARIMTNTVSQNTIVDDKNITNENKHNTNIEIPGIINVRYIDKETGEDITDKITTTGLVGENYNSESKEIEGYILVDRPITEEYEYRVETQDVVYAYERIKLKVETRVNGEGGTIAGDEIVNYGDNSTENYIKIRANEGYVIESIKINGEELKIEENLDTMTVSNFIKMTSDKLVEVTFKKKNIVVNVPKTNSNAKLVILGTIIVIIALIISLYMYNKNRIKQ